MRSCCKRENKTLLFLFSFSSVTDDAFNMAYRIFHCQSIETRTLLYVVSNLRLEYYIFSTARRVRQLYSSLKVLTSGSGQHSAKKGKVVGHYIFWTLA